MIDNFEIIGQIIFLEVWLRNIPKDDNRSKRLRAYADGLKFGLGIESKTTPLTESD